MTDAVYARVEAALSRLQLTTMLQHLSALTQQAATLNWSVLDYLDQLTQAEVNARFERDVQRKLRLARLPFFKTLDQFDFAFQPSVNERLMRDLVSLRFVTASENVLFLGPPGVGKTHLAVSLGMAALTSGLSVLFYSVADLLDQLTHDARADRLPQRMAPCAAHSSSSWMKWATSPSTNAPLSSCSNSFRVATSTAALS